MSTKAKLGPMVRSLRKNRGWTLSELAKRSGLSVSTLSKAERDQQALTYDKLLLLAQGLQVDVSALFDNDIDTTDPAQTTSRRSISRADDGAVVDTANYTYMYLCTDLLKKKFVPIVAEIRARSLEEFGELVKHAGEEFSYVLEGTVEVHTEHYAPALLKTGESMYIDSRMGHAYIARGRGRCRILSICTGPEATLEESMAQHFGTSKSSKVYRSKRT
jgi:transcriptional regulator with XRE-family HTH domain